MTHSPWSSELETGISTIDLDHQTLLTLVNRVIAASEEPNLPALKASLVELQAEMVAHFKREEHLMAECMYAAAAQHQEEHQQLAEEIQDQIDELHDGKGNVSFIARFMRNWLLQHIATRDTHFARAILTQDGTTDRRQGDTEDFDVYEERRLDNLESILWTSKLTLGIESIDANHHAMIDLLNAIVSCRASGNKTVLASLLQQFANKTASDFQIEEELMLKLNYADAATHKDEHLKLLDEFANQVDDWREDRISAELLSRFMYHWLLRHIAALDVPLGDAIRKQIPASNEELISPRPAN